MFIIVFLFTLGIYCATSFFLVRIWNYNNDRFRTVNNITDLMQRNWTIGSVLMVVLLWVIFNVSSTNSKQSSCVSNVRCTLMHGFLGNMQ